jgi:hypothetical protein
LIDHRARTTLRKTSNGAWKEGRDLPDIRPRLLGNLRMELHQCGYGSITQGGSVRRMQGKAVLPRIDGGRLGGKGKLAPADSNHENFLLRKLRLLTVDPGGHSLVTRATHGSHPSSTCIDDQM